MHYSLTIANQMLSLIGSLQPDPFNPEHATARASSAAPESTLKASEDPDPQDGDIELAKEDSPEEDGFDSLAHLRAEAARAAERRLAKEKEDKRKKNEAKARKKLEKLKITEDEDIKPETPVTPAPKKKKSKKLKAEEA
jgi:DNA-directed RNA polymerase I subunit RPA43